MPTPFKATQSAASRVSPDDWGAQTDKPRRSVFANYRGAPALAVSQEPLQPESDANVPSLGGVKETLQAQIDSAVARVFLYQFLARAFEDPAIESWKWLTSCETDNAFQNAVRAPRIHPEKSARELAAKLKGGDFERFKIAYVTAFGHAARGDCPLNEIEYGDLKADPLFQPHRLADLAAFYRAFGLEVADKAAERPDHIGMELEFMSVLAARDAYAHEHQLDEEQLQLCREAQKKFLREHLGRWSPAFSRRLARAATDEILAALADFTRDFIAAECERFGLPTGSEDLLLRPVDDAAENLCASCGLKTLPPGASFTEGT
jgi:DMSO reductase family type II enzyme chaperone